MLSYKKAYPNCSLRCAIIGTFQEKYKRKIQVKYHGTSKRIITSTTKIKNVETARL